MGKFVVPLGDRSGKYPTQATFVVARYDIGQALGYTCWRGVRKDIIDGRNMTLRLTGGLQNDDYLSRDAIKRDEKVALAQINKGLFAHQ